MDTDRVIAQLVQDARPVRRLSDPLLRTAAWLTVALAAVGLSVWLMGPRPDLGVKLHDARYVVEQAAALLTAVTTALAAFVIVIPGRSRYWVALPIAPLSLWLASVGWGCISDWLRGATLFESDWSCLPAVALVGAIPAVAMVLMLRRGAPLLPHLAVALGALAAAALGDFGLRLFHTIDAGLMVLVWQIGSVAILTVILTQYAPTLLRWRHAAIR
jgi:hypothetical protein